MNETYYVYIHIFPNKKVYIGITSTDPIKRWKNGYGYRGQPYLFNAIQKYGWDKIQHKILYSNLSKHNAEQKEIELIRIYRSTDKRYGYNIGNGGMSRGKHSEETIRKISASEKGKIISKEQIEKRKNTMMERYPNGFKFDETTRLLRSQRMMGNKYSKGGSRNTQYIEKISIRVICVETNETFKSVMDASRKMNINHSNLYYAVIGNRKTAGGYHWKRVD